MSTKLLNDVASILAELEVSYEEADEIGNILTFYFLDDDEQEAFVDKASNAPSVGECGC
jgi:hypothetical protein